MSEVPLYAFCVLIRTSPCVPQLKPGKYVSVTMYVDDKGSAKELPHNERATALAAAAGVASTDVVGDAFVARAYDNEVIYIKDMHTYM